MNSRKRIPFIFAEAKTNSQSLILGQQKNSKFHINAITCKVFQSPK